MRVLWFNWRCWLHPSAGGAEVHVHEVAKRWVRWGHEVTLFCGRYEGCREKDEVDGVEIIRRGGPYDVYVHAAREYLWNLRRRNYDVVIDDVNGVPFFTPLYVERPKIAVMHHLVKDIFFKELPWHKAVVGYVAERSIPLIYQGVPFVAVSESTKEELMNLGLPEENITVVHYGLNNKLFETGEKSPFPTVLYFNRLKKYKNVDHLIRAFKTVKERFSKARLLIVGCRGGEYEEELKGLVSSLNLQNDVEFHAFIKEDGQKNMVLQRAWVHILPSRREGWGISVIEAAICGTPTIAYNVPGLNCSVRNSETGILVPYADIEALAEAMTKMLIDDELRERLSEGAVKWAKRFTWDKTAEETLRVLKRVICS